LAAPATTSNLQTKNYTESKIKSDQYAGSSYSSFLHKNRFFFSLLYFLLLYSAEFKDYLVDVYLSITTR